MFVAIIDYTHASGFPVVVIFSANDGQFSLMGSSPAQQSFCPRFLLFISHAISRFSDRRPWFHSRFLIVIPRSLLPFLFAGSLVSSFYSMPPPQQSSFFVLADTYRNRIGFESILLLIVYNFISLYIL